MGKKSYLSLESFFGALDEMSILFLEGNIISGQLEQKMKTKQLLFQFLKKKKGLLVSGSIPV